MVVTRAGKGGVLLKVILSGGISRILLREGCYLSVHLCCCRENPMAEAKKGKAYEESGSPLWVKGGVWGGVWTILAFSGGSRISMCEGTLSEGCWTSTFDEGAVQLLDKVDRRGGFSRGFSEALSAGFGGLGNDKDSMTSSWNYFIWLIPRFLSCIFTTMAGCGQTIEHAWSLGCNFLRDCRWSDSVVDLSKKVGTGLNLAKNMRYVSLLG